MTRSFRAVTALMVAACSLAGASAAEAKTLDVTLLGDSYSAGVGGGNTSGGPCYRSPNTWGQVYGALARTKGHTVNVTNLACGGASVAGADTPEKSLAVQISQVPANTDLVLMTIGGNDADFGGWVPWCVLPVLAGPINCRTALETAETKISPMQANLTEQLEDLGDRLHSGAKVVLLTYPYLARPSGYLLKTWFASFDSGAGIREWGDQVDQATQQAASAASEEVRTGFATVISTKARFAGHEPDQNPWQENPQRWVLEISGLPELVDYYHPNVRGYQEMAQVAFDHAGPGGDFGAAQ